MSYTISCKGLSTYEQGLVQEQIRILHGRTNQLWKFDANRDDFDVIISRSPLEVPAWAIQILAGNEEAPLNQNRIRSEWPLRIVGLLDILNECEKRLPTLAKAHGSARQPQEQLFSELVSESAGHLLDNQMLVLETGDFECFILNDGDNGLTLFSGFETTPLLATLLEAGSAKLRLRIQERNEAMPLPLQSMPLQAFLWELAWREPVIDSHLQDTTNTTFHIQQWPMLGLWYTEPPMFQLAALFGRKFETLENGARASGMPLKKVASFIHACEVTGLGVERHQQVTTPLNNQHNKAQQHGAMSMLANLRAKLGLVFAHE